MLNEKSVRRTAVVIGAGTMGGGIAAQLANVGWQVRLLDVAGPDPNDPKTRSQVAAAGLDRGKKNKPPLLYLPEFAERIQVGNIEDDLDRIRDADWVVEAVAEKMDVKKQVMALIEAHAGPETIISTNTSGLSLREMTEGRRPDFKRRFLGTHFFNPPRYLKLLELIALPETDPEITDGFARFAERVLGRRVVMARDTPGFISNRLGMWMLLDTIHTAIDDGLSVEEVDYLTGPLIGRPRSATFRLADIIGFDIIADIARSQVERLPNDPYRSRLLLPEGMQHLMAAGRLGEKTGAGFYKREGKEILALDFTTLDYRPRQEIKIEAVEALLKRPLQERFTEIAGARDTKWGGFLNRILQALVAYARHIGPEVADDVLAIDRVMQWGFNWEIGPFEIADLMRAPSDAVHYSGTGAERLYRLFGTADLQPMPAEPEYLSLTALKMEGKTVRESPEASLVDLGDGVACLEFRTKMNTFNPPLTAFVNTAREIAERNFAALVIGNQGPHFSAGFNLKVFLDAIAASDWKGIDTMLRDLQDAFMGLKYASVPVVAAPHGYTLGGGCECVLHCYAVQAAAELFLGLPETSVGILPAGGGTTEMLARAMDVAAGDTDPFPHVEHVFDLIVSAKFSGSADEARKMGYLRETDGISINADRLLYEAKQRALGLANAGYTPPVKNSVWVLGEETMARLRLKIHWQHRSGAMTDHDRVIAEQVAFVLSGGNLPYAQAVGEDHLLQLEREAFIALCKEPKSVERMRHTLETGKPLKN
ncbi:MAG TPA: 3-hydroxyacyl-CoA dehydrogenase/enoyl-CoA hydratase family protein [Chthonomonadaceae bacterium]|nr:3-hydroxyacyl-CoA dehydrogenase/enoyl-CoA hydratase family protein [Chthonomonadaceae bacterium]